MTAPAMNPDDGVVFSTVATASGHVFGRATLSQPASLNALSLAMVDRLAPRLGAWAGDAGVAGVILDATGDKAFCAGGDVARASTMARRFGEAFEALAAFGGVSIAAINGYAMGGGLECALACDLRVAEAHAVMALPEASVGLLPCAGGTQWLAWTVGESWAKRMVLLGERVDAATAARIGLVDEVVPRGGALARALEMAAAASRQSPGAVRACKQLINGARSGSPQDALVREREAFVGLFETEDQREGVAAFLGKRAPRWRNG